MSSTFTELNGFQKSVDGVFRKNSDVADFAYTDGAESERTLKQILSSASDLASDSVELEDKICDWPTEYHLSTTRANLLRCLDLSGVKRVLELGCGCGSISRYLGEQPHLEVDSIEGSSTRAALAALRCKDLDNVRISTANFNQVEFPENYYDLVLFVGVTEYAGRFSERDSDEEALQDLLQMAQKASSDSGTTLIAIENRTGLKYLLGASEDHFGKPYVGIQNYPEKVGICTYTKKEWQQQIALANFLEYEFLYPFPDYKIPTQVIHNNAVDGDSDAIGDLSSALNKVKSRDYLMPFDLAEREAMLWQGLYEAGTLGDHANSFMILLSNQSTSIEKLANFSIKQFPEKQFESRYTLQYASKETTDHETQQSSLISELQSQLSLIHQSRSWRYFAKIRPLLQAFGLGRK